MMRMHKKKGSKAATREKMEKIKIRDLLMRKSLTVNDTVMFCGAVLKGNALSVASITMVTTSSAFQQLSPLSK